ncbi:hypothetical protein NUU61_001056 [Penicillium alfredii]|uniref:Uncharacterized protein n=1 Tax=Penicillium alfredii TaxID=1506179 RepID=A0A9W9GBU9_9EURO|nr:uncharacterized protein NUU61_001056 [Penicillium alfredii]KAJ5115297.1 hypothetical protein NUU61_001056 [Penicillium alfredii]
MAKRLVPARLSKSMLHFTDEHLDMDSGKGLGRPSATVDCLMKTRLLEDHRSRSFTGSTSGASASILHDHIADRNHRALFNYKSLQSLGQWSLAKIAP